MCMCLKCSQLRKKEGGETKRGGTQMRWWGACMFELIKVRLCVETNWGKLRSYLDSIYASVQSPLASYKKKKKLYLEWWWRASDLPNERLCKYSVYCLYFSTFLIILHTPWLPWRSESSCQWRKHKFHPWVGKIPWRRKWQPTPVFFPGKSERQRSMAGYSPWGHKELDRT